MECIGTPGLGGGGVGGAFRFGYFWFGVWGLGGLVNLSSSLIKSIKEEFTAQLINLESKSIAHR